MRTPIHHNPVEYGSLFAVVVFALNLTACSKETPESGALELLTVLPVEGPYNLQPSGLAIRDGVLFSISDKHPTTLFEVSLEQDVARFRAVTDFSLPIGVPPETNIDLEGITSDGDGRIVMASETARRMLMIDEKGTSKWITPDMGAAGEKAGLFAKNGGDLEGIVWLGEDDFLLAAERQPRGLIRVRTHANPPIIDAWQMEDSAGSWSKGRSPDFAGLCRWDGRVFVLERNRHAVTELIPEGSRFRLGHSWSYASVENDPAWHYSNMRFGRAEGIVMTDEKIYIILDNNGDARASDPADKRPLLFIFRNTIGEAYPG